MFSFLRQEPNFYQQIIRLSIPIVLQNILTSTLAMADTFMVGMLGEASIAALTLANIPIFVLQLFLFGVQSGSSILISQNWGKQNLPAIHRIMGVSMSLALSVSGIFALVLFLWPQEFLGLFGNEPEVVALAAGYGKWIGFAFLLNSMTLMYVGAYRSMGRPELGMYMLGISMLLNLFFNWIFIYGNLGAPALGVTGAAVGTLLARSCEVLIMLFHYFTTKKFRVNLALALAPGRETYGQFFRNASPVVLNETVWGVGTAVFPAIMGHMEGSTEILAAMAISTNVERLVMAAGFGLGNCSAIIVGRSVGSGMAKEKVQTIGQCLPFLGFSVGAVTGLVLMLVTHTLLPWVVAPLFQLSSQATAIASQMLGILALFCCFRTFNTVIVVGVFRGGGDLKFCTLADTLPLWCVAIPLGFLFGVVLKLSIGWVCLAMASEQVVKFFVAKRRIRTTVWINDLTQEMEEEETP